VCACFQGSHRAANDQPRLLRIVMFGMNSSVHPRRAVGHEQPFWQFRNQAELPTGRGPYAMHGPQICIPKPPHMIRSCVWLILFLAPLVGCLDIAPRGVVHEIRSQQPVAGATVDLDCRKYEFHGTSSIRTITRQSDSRGRYRFAISDVYDCDVILAHVGKSGYVDASQIRDSLIQVPFVESGQVPGYVYLARADDVHRLQLEGLRQQSESTFEFIPKGSEALAREGEYETVGKALSRSLKITTTPAETAWVRSQYCGRLEARWKALTDEERAAAMRFDDVDPREQLAAFCNAPLPSESAPPSQRNGGSSSPKPEV